MTGVAPAPTARPARRTAPTYRPRAPAVAFGLFLVLTGVLLVRPTEIIPSLVGVPVFQVVILTCLAVSFPWVLAQLNPAALATRPITVCVLGLAAAVPLSLVTHGAIDDSVGPTVEFFKVVAYYLVLMAVVDTPQRLRTLMAWLLGCFALHTALALMHFHGLADIPAMNPVYDFDTNKETGQVVAVARMCGVGLFGNPNDLSRIVVVGIALALYLMGELPRVAWPILVGLAGMFGFALMETHSRGGFVDLAITLLILLQLRVGGKKAAVLGLVAVPVFLAIFAGRQTDLTTDEGTGQQRIQLWVEGFAAVRETPILGIGAGQYRAITDGLGTHNSFVECYVELGLVGGTLFLAAVYLALWQTYRLGPARMSAVPEALARTRPYLLAIVAGYAIGMLTSSRNYLMPTYLMLGLAAAYQQLAWVAVPRTIPRPNGRIVFHLAAVSAIVLIGLYAFARMSVRWQ
ncbi:MAG TPA: O-antigen ligase family protein [Gemmataceae bacterium]|nr:O-antigen ligase family protein [Gemmataceae bacterium]